MIDGVHIWRAALDEAGWADARRLPTEERERAASFLREEPGRRWVAARWALRRVLEGYLAKPAAEIELTVSEHGKPHLRDGGGIEFNVSHSNGLALVAVTEGRTVGVDVEMIEPERDLIALAERALPEEDVAAVRVAGESERPALFYAAWARHEARIKCGPDVGAVENFDASPEYAAAVAVAAPQVGPIDCRSLRAG
jgi:4'-phosphopantetheinyl transferase